MKKEMVKRGRKIERGERGKEHGDREGSWRKILIKCLINNKGLSGEEFFLRYEEKENTVFFESMEEGERGGRRSKEGGEIRYKR
jgi:hypothetical protein